MGEPIELCEECGLPMVECSAVTIGRIEAEKWLRAEGYSGLEAREAALRLIPIPKRLERTAMPDSMLERAARALLDKVQFGYGMTEAEAATYARAVLQAIREPSEAMLIAAQTGPGKPTNTVASGMWVRMIDAALAETPSEP